MAPGTRGGRCPSPPRTHVCHCRASTCASTRVTHRRAQRRHGADASAPCLELRAADGGDALHRGRRVGAGLVPLGVAPRVRSARCVSRPAGLAARRRESRARAKRPLARRSASRCRRSTVARRRESLPPTCQGDMRWCARPEVRSLYHRRARDTLRIGRLVVGQFGFAAAIPAPRPEKPRSRASTLQGLRAVFRTDAHGLSAGIAAANPN
jgi:hypothetical protein